MNFLPRIPSFSSVGWSLLTCWSSFLPCCFSLLLTVAHCCSLVLLSWLLTGAHLDQCRVRCAAPMASPMRLQAYSHLRIGCEEDLIPIDCVDDKGKVVVEESSGGEDQHSLDGSSIGSRRSDLDSGVRTRRQRAVQNPEMNLELNYVLMASVSVTSYYGLRPTVVFVCQLYPPKQAHFVKSPYILKGCEVLLGTWLFSTTDVLEGDLNFVVLAIIFAYEMRKNSASKEKTDGMPMKTLIAQEMLKELDSKRRSPSVVARLMGLDALPTEPVSTDQIKAADNHEQKKLSRKQPQQPKSARDVWCFSEKAKALESKSTKKHSLPKSQQWAVGHRDQKVLLETHPFRNNLQEKQQHDLKEVFETWQVSKLQDHSKSLRLEKPDMQLVEEEMLDCEELNETKMALVRQKFKDAKRLATDEKLQQSKEFLDALEVLQANKDAFLKFLQEPNSMFAKHRQDLQSTAPPSSQLRQITILKSSNEARTGQLLKEGNSKGRDSKEGKAIEKRFKKPKVPKDFTEKKELQEVQSLHSDKLLSACSMHDKYKQYAAASSNDTNDICSLPTRIVVLKPGPGRAQNVPTCSLPSHSPRSQTCFKDPKEVERGSSQDYLKEVKVRLERELRENCQNKYRSTVEGGQEEFINGHKYPGEIATEIARQVRERVTKDLTSAAPRPMEDLMHLRGFAENVRSLNRSANSYGEVDTESYTPVTEHSWEYTNIFSPPSSTISRLSDSPESTVNREAKKRLLERWRSTHENEKEQQLRRISSTLGEMLALPEIKNHISESKSSKQNYNGAVEENQVLLNHMLDLGSKNKKPITQEGAAEWEGSLGHGNGDDNKDGSPRNLLRSRSVPASATTYDKGVVEMQCKVSNVHPSNAHEIVPDMSSSSLPVELVKSRNEKSTFKEKFSSLKGSFLLRGRRSSSKKTNCLPIVHLDKELCDPLQQMPVESDQWKEKAVQIIHPVHQEPCEVLVDALEMTTEPVEYSAGTLSETSPIDDERSEQSILEASDRNPVSVEREGMVYGIDTDLTTKAISSEQLQLGFPTPSSPTKELSLSETTALESNSEKGEHPSPVSVLDLPFQEEFSSPQEFKEINSNIHELRLRLHLLKFDASQGSIHTTKNLLHGGNLLFTDYDIQEADIGAKDNCNSPSEATTPPISNSLFSAIQNVDFKSLKVDGILCSEEKQVNLLYIKNVLVASGFTGDCDVLFARWHSPSCPLDPSLFEKIEDLYRDGMRYETNSSDNALAKGGEGCGIEANRSKSERHLLYNCINEVLLEILGPYFNQHPWVRPTKMNLQPMASGKQLVEKIWANICHQLYPQLETQHTLENLVAKDLSREVVWMELRDDIEMVGHEIERTIFNDLIEEVLCDLVS
eukprot:Gb_21932 [translate_table: standard]